MSEKPSLDTSQKQLEGDFGTEDETPSINDLFSESYDTAISSENTARLVIADVHGDYEAFSRSLDLGREFFESKHCIQNYELVLLGDLFDRGPDSLEILQDVISLLGSDKKVHLLCGNHESMMIKAFYDPVFSNIHSWFENGGLSTLHSFSKLLSSPISSQILNDYQSVINRSDINLLAQFYHANRDVLLQTIVGLSKHDLISKFVSNLSLCLSRGSQLYVHAGFLPSFILSYSALCDWDLDLNQQFLIALGKFVSGDRVFSPEMSFEDFLTASSVRGGNTVAGPLWADLRDIQSLSIFDDRMLMGLLGAVGTSQMVVGHSVVAEPSFYRFKTASRPNQGVLFMDCGISKFYPGNMTAQCLCVLESGESFVLDQNQDFTRLDFFN